MEVPSYIAYVGCEDDMQVPLDIKYTQIMLSHNPFEVYVRNNNAASSHYEDIYCGLSREHIMNIMNDFHQQTGVFYAFLDDKYNQDGFFIIMDEWENAWVYIGNDATRFNDWIHHAPHEGMSSFVYFQNRTE
jgi:hypothetical protein